MISMLRNDAEGVKATILPAEGADFLWQGEPPPKQMQTEIEKTFQGLKLVRIQEGEKVSLPSGKDLTVEKGMIDEKKILVWAEINNERMPTPFWMVKTADGWRVDAGPLIAARKAAARARGQERAK